MYCTNKIHWQLTQQAISAQQMERAKLVLRIPCDLPPFKAFAAFIEHEYTNQIKRKNLV